MIKIKWGHPLANSPLAIALSFQAAAFQLMMKPQNQLAVWRSLMDPRNYRKSTHRGHPMETQNGDDWFYSDTKQPVSEAPNRPCGHCDKSDTAEGHDGCLGTLPGVKNACCGHGIASDAYVQFSDGSRVGGMRASLMIRDFKEMVSNDQST